MIEYVKRLESGFYKQEYVEALFQETTYYPYDIYSAYCFAHINAWIGAGKVLTAKVETRDEPYSDKMVEKNNEILSNLPYPFEAEFTGYKSSQERNDGTFQWSEKIQVGQILYKGEEIVKNLSPQMVPLEVGSTRADRTYTHILQGGLARWPYESSWIWLFMPMPDLVNWISNRRARLRVF